jgi:hypothetical protein
MDLLYHPWELYIMGPDDSVPRVLLPGVVDGFIHDWVPRSTWVTFSGEYQRAEGIWLVDVVTHQVTRLWPYRTAFDWSPDGRQMLLLEPQTVGGRAADRLVIVTVPRSANGPITNHLLFLSMLPGMASISHLYLFLVVVAPDDPVTSGPTRSGSGRWKPALILRATTLIS